MSEVIDEEKVEEVVAMEEREFQSEEESVSLEKKRFTSMKTNRKVFMQPPRPVKEECIIQARAEAWKSVWRQYKDSETMAGDSQICHQLSRQEIEGKKSLVKKK